MANINNNNSNNNKNKNSNNNKNDMDDEKGYDDLVKSDKILEMASNFSIELSKREKERRVVKHYNVENINSEAKPDSSKPDLASVAMVDTNDTNNKNNNVPDGFESPTGFAVPIKSFLYKDKDSGAKYSVDGKPSTGESSCRITQAEIDENIEKYGKKADQIRIAKRFKKALESVEKEQIKFR